jgi:hypothetical protein
VARITRVERASADGQLVKSPERDTNKSETEREGEGMCVQGNETTQRGASGRGCATARGPTEKSERCAKKGKKERQRGARKG